MLNYIQQTRPPPPSFTEKHIPDLKDRVYLVTGGSGGIGKDVCSILYSKNATVVLAARNEAKAQATISAITEAHAGSTGSIEFLHLDLDDLTTIKVSAEKFKSRFKRLDVLFNNAGVMNPPSDSKTKQGYELQLGTNCVAPHLFTKLLTPLLLETTKTAPAASVRVVWVSSSGADLVAPKGGVELDNLDYHKSRSVAAQYGASKAGNYFQATEYARLYKKDGIVSVVSYSGLISVRA